jgi:hypothetical protein
MLTCSETIGVLAAALARAQQDLTNPEKSLTAALPSGPEQPEGRTFRYASLASGLDIVRKSLGRQEIASVQTTAIDQEAGLVRLTTTLAHSSGEWLSSEWPVCQVAELADPQRMGAALTYARRYALFTLVGIAGEDDLDAPPVRRSGIAPGNGQSHPSEPPPSAHGATATPIFKTSRRRQAPPRPTPSILSGEASSTLREKLIASVAALNSTEALTEWAQQSMPAKNTLVDTDVRAIETAFEAKRSELGELDEISVDSAPITVAEAAPISPPPTPVPPESAGMERQPTETTRVMNRAPERLPTTHDTPRTAPELRATRRRSARRDNRREAANEGQPPASPARQASGLARRASGTTPRTAVDKSALTFDEAKRVRDKEHLLHVAAQPCVLCSARPAEAHHIRFAQPRALGRKVSDEFTVPLCRKHHRDVHRSGNEAAWWHDLGIDPIDIALQLWDETLIARGFVPPPLLPSEAGEGSKQD